MEGFATCIPGQTGHMSTQNLLFSISSNTKTKWRWSVPFRFYKGCRHQKITVEINLPFFDLQALCSAFSDAELTRVFTEVFHLQGYLCTSPPKLHLQPGPQPPLSPDWFQCVRTAWLLLARAAAGLAVNFITLVCSPQTVTSLIF